MKKTDNNKCWQRCGEIGTIIHYWWEGKLWQLLLKNSLAEPQTDKYSNHITQQFHSWVCTRGDRKLKSVCTKTWTPASVSTVFINSQKVETFQISINWWADKQAVAQTHNGLFFRHRKECSADTRYNMLQPLRHHATQKKPDTNGAIHHYDSVYRKYPELANP